MTSKLVDISIFGSREISNIHENTDLRGKRLTSKYQSSCILCLTHLLACEGWGGVVDGPELCHQ